MLPERSLPYRRQMFYSIYTESFQPKMVKEHPMSYNTIIIHISFKSLLLEATDFTFSLF